MYLYIKWWEARRGWTKCVLLFLVRHCFKKAKNLCMYRGASRLSTRNCEEKTCEKIVTPVFHFDHLLTQVPKSPYFIHGSESAKICTHFFWVWLQRSGLYKKRPKMYVFGLSPFLKLNFDKSRVIFLPKLLVFLKCYMKIWVLA